MDKKRDSYHHGDLRATLLGVAAHMIAERGVEGVTMRGLAEQIGVSRSAPYRHFADKAALLAAVAEDGFKRLAAGLRAAGAEQGSPRASNGALSRRTRIPCIWSATLTNQNQGPARIGSSSSGTLIASWRGSPFLPTHWAATPPTSTFAGR